MTTNEPQPARLPRAYAWSVVALRYLIVPGWIAAAVAATLLLPGLHRSRGGALSDLVAKKSPAVTAEERASRLFPVALAPDTLVVQRDPAGLSTAAQKRAGERALAASTGPDRAFPEIQLALPVLNTLGLFPSSRERSTTAITYLFFPSRYSFATRARVGKEYAAQASQPGDALVGVTGPAPARIEQYDAIQEWLPYVSAATAVLILLLIGFTFRAVGAPLLVLAAGGIGYFVDVRVLGWVADRSGVSIPSEIEPLLVVLLLGITTDYSIFYLSSQRRRLLAGEPPVDAARRTGAMFTPTIVVAALMVAAGAASLLVARLSFVRAFGPGLALTALVSGAIAVTFVPAALALFGKSLFWPGREVAEPEPAEEEPNLGRRSLRERAAYWATARPLALVIVALSIAGLGAAASGLAQTRLGFGLIAGLPGGSQAHRAAVAAGKGFAPGILAPTEIDLEQPGIVDRRTELERLEGRLNGQPGVAGVIGPRERPLDRRRGAVLSATGNAARFAVVFSSDPFEAPAISHLRALDRRLPDLMRESGLGGARFGVTGATAVASDTISDVVHDLGKIALVALAIDFVLLALFLRALVAPLYLLAASLLAFAATMGLTTYVFQDLLGYPGLTYWVPFATAVLLVSLGSDYNVFVTGRIWEEGRRRPLREAVAVAAPRAARAITLAGLVLAGSFALLALVPLRAFAEFAFAMAAGVLIDSFVVRSFLVPALISLVGGVGSWPGRRLRPSPGGLVYREGT